MSHTLPARVQPVCLQSIPLWRRLRTAALDPFRFQALRGGLTWGAGQVTLTVAGRTQAGIRMLDTVAVPLPDTSAEALSGALTRVRHQCPGYLPPAILGLDSTVLGYRLLIPPDPLPADLPAWVVAQTPQLMPPGLRLAELTLDFRVVRPASRPVIQVVWARRARLEPLVAAVDAAGFRVAGVSPQPLAAAEGVRVEADTTALVLCDPEAVTVVPLIETLPAHLHEVAWADSGEETDWMRLAARIRLVLPSQTRRVTLVTPAAQDATAPSVALADALVQHGVEVTSTTGLAGATALARAGLDPTQKPFQLIPAHGIDWVQQDQDRRWALRIGWGGGLLVVLLLVLGLLFDRSYTHQQHALAAQMEANGAWLARMRALATTEQALRAEVAALRTLQAGHPGVAGLLETMGRTVPEHVWLRTLRVERQADTGGYQVRITGIARTEAALRAFLAGLEAQAGWRPNRALTTTRLDPETVQRQTGVRIPLIRFDLTCVAAE